MFSKNVYITRRSKLRAAMGGEIVFIPGHLEVPRNYTDNTHDFRQNSTFAYFAGHQIPKMSLILTPSEEILVGYTHTMDDIIWTGPLPTLRELAAQVGIERVMEESELAAWLQGCIEQEKRVHYLPPFQGEQLLYLSDLMGITPGEVRAGVSPRLVEAVVSIRNIKEEREVAQIEEALLASYDMYVAGAKMLTPGNFEWQVKGAMIGAALARHCQQSFHPILTIHGEVLHNHSWDNQIPEKGLFLLDSGAETPLLYASDITRTFPIGGVFDEKQKAVYEVVLAAQLESIAMSGPGVSFKEMHLTAAKVIARGLTELGLMKGDPEEAVAAGAHALFFPHGLGHMIGMDVHDMEDLGDMVGYGPELSRDTQFGLAFLRMARPLEPGHVFTVEPGIYFIPALINKWRQEGTNASFINFDEVASYVGTGGIRIEDDILVTATGHRVLGAKPIPKTVPEIESLFASLK